MRTVWLNGALVDPASAAVGIDNVAVRFGEGLFETMYGVDGSVPRLAQHLDRIINSADALAIDIASRDDLRTAIEVAAHAGGADHQRVRLTAAPNLVLVEVAETEPLSTGPRTAVASVVANMWFPGRAVAEHKTLSYGSYRLAQRRAVSVGATIALLADDRGRLGEADTGNLFAVIDGELVTPPVEGLLPGVARGALLSAGFAREGELTAEALVSASELLATNAVNGVTVLRDVAGAPWSRDTPSRHAIAAHEELAAGG